MTTKPTWPNLATLAKQESAVRRALTHLHAAKDCLKDVSTINLDGKIEDLNLLRYYLSYHVKKLTPSDYEAAPTY